MKSVLNAAIGLFLFFVTSCSSVKKEYAYTYIHKPEETHLSPYSTSKDYLVLFIQNRLNREYMFCGGEGDTLIFETYFGEINITIIDKSSNLPDINVETYTGIKSLDNLISKSVKDKIELELGMLR